MITFPKCKINIGLHVLNKRPDGYHNIETFFYPLNLTDGLEIIQTDSYTEITLSGKKLPDDDKPNLCILAYELLKKDYDLPPVKIHLHKKIPHGAGLGGGSSDAAETLKLLNQIFHLELNTEKLIEYAKKIGSDIPFFIYNKPLIAKEKGDVFDDSFDFSLKGYYIAIGCPKETINTKDAYNNIKPDEKRESLKILLAKPIDKWKGLINNDFEDFAFNNYPNILKLKQAFYSKGAVYASLTGSGAAVYGIFKENPYSLKKEIGNNLIWVEKINS